MTPLDAAHATVHDYPGGSESLAPRLGMSGSILRNKVNGNINTNHLTLVEADRLMAMTGDHRILDSLADNHGYVIVPIAHADTVSDMAILELVTQVWHFVGDLGISVDDAFQGGRISKKQVRQVSDSIHVLEQAIHTLLARIDQLAE